MAQSFVTYAIPLDVDEQVFEYQERIRKERNLSPKQFTKSGAAMRELLALATAAQRLGLRADTLPQLAELDTAAK